MSDQEQYRDPSQPPAAPVPRDVSQCVNDTNGDGDCPKCVSSEPCTVSASDLIEESAGIDTGRDRASTEMEDLRDQVFASVNQLVVVHAAGNGKQTAHWCSVVANRAAEMIREALGQAVVDKIRADQTKIVTPGEMG